MDFIVQHEIRTYRDMQNWFVTHGWGCKSCGQLQSLEWWQCQGDTYCKRCKLNILEPLEDVVLHQYPDDGQPGRQFERQPDDSFGFEYAAYTRQDFERIYGDQPWTWYGV